MHHIPFRLRLQPTCRWGSLQSFPRDLALFKMPTSNGRRGQRRGQRPETEPAFTLRSFRCPDKYGKHAAIEAYPYSGSWCQRLLWCSFVHLCRHRSGQTTSPATTRCSDCHVTWCHWSVSHHWPVNRSTPL